MTPDEAIEALKNINTFRIHPFYGWQEMREVIDVAISALKEIQQYRKIGTVEECREAVMKQKPKTPIRTKDDNLACECGNVIQLKNTRKALYFCTSCGQHIDWDSEPDKFVNENLEGMEE